MFFEGGRIMAVRGVGLRLEAEMTFSFLPWYTLNVACYLG